MAIAPPLVLTLTQRKLYTGDSPRSARFGVQSSLVASVATTQQLEAAFILGPSTGVDRERLLRVASLDEPLDVALINTSGSFNELTFFKDAGIDLGVTAQVGDVIRVSTPPGEWSPDGNTYATADFTITALNPANQRVEVAAPFLWSAAGLTYTVLQPDLVTPRVVTRTGGFTEREDPAALEWRCDQFTTGFETSTEALAHMASTQAYVSSLSQQTKLDVQEFLDTGGNPVINSY